MTRSPYRQPPPGQGYPPQEEPYYDPRARSNVSASMISAIVLGVLALIMMIVMLTTWSGYATVDGEARAEDKANSELRKESEDLSQAAKREQARFKTLNNAEIMKKNRMDTKAAIAKATPGSGAYWKAMYEDARKEARGSEFQANATRLKVEMAEKMRRATPTPPGPTPPTPPPPAP